MKAGILTGHHLNVRIRLVGSDGLCTISAHCDSCTLRCLISAPPEMADATVADLMATHWAATGGDQG